MSSWGALLVLLALLAGFAGVMWLVEPYGGALCAAWLLFDALWLRGASKKRSRSQ